DRAKSGVPGATALAWAVVGLAALRKRKDKTTVRRAHADPFRPRPPRPAGPGGPGGPGHPDANGQVAVDGSGTADATGGAAGSAERPGDQAEVPTQIPPKGWWQVTRRAFKESSADNVGILAGGIADAAFLAVFPALIAGISLFGLVADPETIAQQAEGVLAALPETAQPLLRDQIVSLTQTPSGALTFSFVVSILLALWSASSGTSSLMTGINIAYDEQESRNFVKLRGTALLLTLGAIVFVLLTLALVAVVPALLNALQLGTFINVIVQVVRWFLLVVLIVVALAVVYRLAPDRDAPKFTWTSVGAVVAAVLWVLASLGFSLYVNNFGSYNKTYGALAGVVVLLLWLYLTGYIILLGAEINAESEKQTKKDTTTGPPVPMGERRAEAADTVADPPEPPKKK
ncbi:MAG: YihY/virulence factor BrkB family protein, partial [Pseudonocardia sp.]